MTRHCRIPAPTDFWDAPCCATLLLVIDYALEVLTCALAAEHPGVLDDPPLGDPDASAPDPDRLAAEIVSVAAQLSRLLGAYRTAITADDTGEGRARPAGLHGKPRPR